jgi:hypothetical protein
MATHPYIRVLRDHNHWRRGGDGVMGDVTELGLALDWAIKVCEAADNMINVKGRFHAEKAYKRLEQAVKDE